MFERFVVLTAKPQQFSLNCVCVSATREKLDQTNSIEQFSVIQKHIKIFG